MASLLRSMWMEEDCVMYHVVGVDTKSIHADTESSFTSSSKKFDNL